MASGGEGNGEELLEMFDENEVEAEVDPETMEKAKANPQEVVALAQALKNETERFRTMADRLRDE